MQIGEIPERIPNDAALCAYRVIQEALNNAVRHAEADNIEILLDKEGQTLKLEVLDDGRGFIEAQVKSKVSLGLSSMRERVSMIRPTPSSALEARAKTRFSCAITEAMEPSLWLFAVVAVQRANSRWSLLPAATIA